MLLQDRHYTAAPVLTTMRVLFYSRCTELALMRMAERGWARTNNKTIRGLYFLLIVAFTALIGKAQV